MPGAKGLAPKGSVQDSRELGGWAGTRSHPGHCTASSIGDYHQYLGDLVLTAPFWKVDTTLILKFQVGKLRL